MGSIALQSTTTGEANTAYGYEALLDNVTGTNNIALAQKLVITPQEIPTSTSAISA
jgi:hypothetical protein